MRALALGIALFAQISAPAIACGPASESGPSIPPLAAGVDSELRRATLPKADREKLAALREQIRELAAAGNEEGARKTEEKAMRILGYSKMWLKCGPGTFLWVKFDPPVRS